MGKVTRENVCLRRLVVAYNAFFWVTGPGMIGLGIWLFIALGEYEPVVDREEFSTPAFIVISAGGASVLAGLLGCVGGLSQNRRLLVLYSLLMLTVCAMEVTATVLCFLAYDKAEGKISSMLNTSLQEYSLNKDGTDTMDSIHKELSCCGAKDYKDWSTTQFFTSGVVSPVNALRQVVPRSCCVLRHNLTDCNLGNADGVPLHLNLLFPTGCGPPLVDWLHNVYIITGWTTAGVGATMILALSVVCCLKHALSAFYS